jgi:hypothetical protein
VIGLRGIVTVSGKVIVGLVIFTSFLNFVRFSLLYTTYVVIPASRGSNYVPIGDFP